MMNEDISARGERAAIGGYLPQFDAFALFIYREILDDNLMWIRVADPRAEKLDDIQYATANEIHAYQVKWSIADASLSYNEFKSLLPRIISSWQSLKAFHSPQNKKVIAHLLTNKPLSAVANINIADSELKSFRNLYYEVWVPLKTGQKVNPKWDSVVKEMVRVSTLPHGDFINFLHHFEFNFDYQPENVTIRNVSRLKREEDLVNLRSFIMEKVADAGKPVHFSKEDVLKSLNWETRFKTTFNHELFVDRSRYQPIQVTLKELDNTIESLPGGYIFLKGGPGSGKSTLLTQWSRNRQERIIRYYAFDFTAPASMHNYHERGEAVTLLFDLVVQLRQSGIHKGSVAPYRDLPYLKSTLAKQLEALGEEFREKGVITSIIIDGLDHVPREYKTVTKSFLADLPLPAAIPEGVYIVLGSQFFNLEHLSLEIREEHEKPERNITIAPLGKKEVEQYIDASQLPSPLTDEQRQQVYERSQGHPLYLSYFIEMIRVAGPAIINEFSTISGNIYTYYRKIWEPIEADAELVQLLGLMARMEGPIHLQFIGEWGFKRQILKEFRSKARFLFDESSNSWAFFHNSFRQFLLEYTAINELTDAYDAEYDKELHRMLVGLYRVSRSEPAWKSIYHLYRANEFAQFLQVATPDNFIQQLLEYRPAEEIRRDIQLGLEIASKTKDVHVLVAYLFTLTDLESRLFQLNPASFAKEFLALGKAQTAKDYLRTGSKLHCSKTFALRSARLFFQSGDPVEGRILASLAEPVTLLDAGINIDTPHHYGEVRDELKEWVITSPFFYSLPEILMKVNNITFVGEKESSRFLETEGTLRLRLLSHLCYSLISKQAWDDLDVVLQEFVLEQADEKQQYCFIIQARVEEHLKLKDYTLACRWLRALLDIFDKEASSPDERVFIADIVYKVTGDAAQVKEWIQDLPQPSLTKPENLDYKDNLEAFLPRIKFNKLLNVCGIGVPITQAIPDVQAGKEEKLTVEFERMLCLICQILGDGLQRNTDYQDILKRVQPIVQFYYKDIPFSHSFWYRLTQRKKSYYAFLIYAVSTLGGNALERLGDFLIGEFFGKPIYWPVALQRSLIVLLYRSGYDQDKGKKHLLTLEDHLLAGHDIAGRIQECTAQAKAWLHLKEPELAEKWVRQSIRESIGIGYRKDYQFSTWIEWLQRANEKEPHEAGARIMWFLAHLRHIKDTTEGGAFWHAAEDLLRATFKWNFAAGQQQLQWQLTKGLIDYEDGLAVFLQNYIASCNSEEYRIIVSFYTELFLYFAVSPWQDILEALLQKGFACFENTFFHNYLPGLSDEIKIKALQENRPFLLSVIDKFAADHSFLYAGSESETTHPKEREESRSSNTLRLISTDTRGTSLKEEAVLKMIESYEDFKELLKKEDNLNSSFDWEAVIEKLSPVLTTEQVVEISSFCEEKRNGSELLVLLSTQALHHGDSQLAASLAEKAVGLSNGNGWTKGYDGGSRLNAFKALKSASPTAGTSKALEAFAQDVLTSSSPLYLSQSLPEILPVIADYYDVLKVWETIHGYLQRVMANSSPEEDLPQLVPHDRPVVQELTDLLLYLAFLPVTALNERAKKLLAILADTGNTYTNNTIANLAEGTESQQEAYSEILMFLQALGSKAVAYHEDALQQMALSNNFSIRQNAVTLLLTIGSPVPTTAKRALPAVYSLSLESLSRRIETGKKWFETEVDLENPEDVIRPFGMWVNILAHSTGIGKMNLVHRMYRLMHELDIPEHWSASYENGIKAWLEDIRLKYNCPKQRVMTARRALMHLVTELIDADVLSASDVQALFSMYDYQVPFFKEIAAPVFVPSLKTKGAGYLDQDWLEQIEGFKRLDEGLVRWHADWKVIGECSKVRSLAWGQATETYMMQLCFEEGERAQGEYIFGSAFQQPTSSYFILTRVSSHMLLIRDHFSTQSSMKSRWLAFNPALAINLGWKPDESRMFGWQDSNGHLMVESVFWSDGNMDMPPPHSDSEAGEGWVVVASPQAIERLKAYSPTLFLEKEVKRSRQEDQNILERAERRVVPV